MTRSSMFALAAGVASALLCLSVLSGSPGALLLAYFTQAPLFLVGFAFGFAPAAIACGIALVGLTAATQIATAAVFALLSAVPVLYVVRQGLLSRPASDGRIEWYPPGHMLAGLTAYALVMLGIAALYFASDPGGLEDASRRFIDRLFRLPEAIDRGAYEPALDVVRRYLPSVVLGWSVIITAANAALAQGMLVRTGHNIRPSPAWREVRLPRWPMFVLAASIACAFLPGSIGFLGGNAALIAALPFMLVGLAVLHSVTRGWPRQGRGLALGFIYLTTILLGWPALLVAGIGVVDHWSPLRRWGSGSGRGEEKG